MAVAAVSIFLSPKTNSEQSFFLGYTQDGLPPSLLSLMVSHVMTWLFARSLLNAVILGFNYGVWGVLAYAVYYGSFISAAFIVDSIRFKHGFTSIHDFLNDRFGRVGTRCYHVVVGIRLMSEVFANLLVVGLLFGPEGSGAYIGIILFFSLFTLFYSVQGGLRASIRTGGFQMIVFTMLLAALIGVVLGIPEFSWAVFEVQPFNLSEPGVVLLLVAFLHVISYPMHDPVLMDRGFIADRQTTRRSFFHAYWMSTLFIVIFGILGVFAASQALVNEAMNTVLLRLLGPIPMLFFSAALIVAAMSSLNSTLSSSAKWVALDMKVMAPTLKNGRTAMCLFLLLSVLLVFVGSNDVFTLFALSGLASLYLLPVIVFSVCLGWSALPTWCYGFSFVLALGATLLYFFESSQYTQVIASLTGISDSPSQLLALSLIVVVGSFLAFCLAKWIQVRWYPVYGG